MSQSLSLASSSLDFSRIDIPHMDPKERKQQKYPMSMQLSGIPHKEAFDKLTSFLQATERDFVVQLDCNIVLKDHKKNE
jgi:hypothetical protein